MEASGISCGDFLLQTTQFQLNLDIHKFKSLNKFILGYIDITKGDAIL